MLVNMQPKAMMVCTDGSEDARDAFYQAFEFLTDDYHLFVTHISDSNKLYLPFEYKTTFIWEDYKHECLSRLIKKRYDLVFQEKDYEDNNVRNQILFLAETLKVDYLFFGYSGRKGKKMDPSLLGQTVKNSLYNTHLPFVIVKRLLKRKDKPNKGFNFMVCLDGSEKSFKALATCLTLSNCKNDEIYAVTAPSIQGQHNLEAVKAKFAHFEANYKDRKLWFRALEPSNDPAKGLIDFVNFNEKINFDFVVLGNNGIRAQLDGMKFFGTLSEKLLGYVKANLIIIP